MTRPAAGTLWSRPKRRSRFEELREQTRQFHARHPEVWRLFCAFTEDRIARGFAHYSADAVMHQVRWHTDAPQDDGELPRINNNHVTFYARAFMRLHPEHEGFFRLRRQRSRLAPAKGRPDTLKPEADAAVELDAGDEWAR